MCAFVVATNAHVTLCGLHRSPGHPNILVIYINIKECKAPCKTMDIQSRLMRQIPTTSTGIKIMFDPIVRVTKSSPTIELMTLFSNIGGCLGLTLGYSILQLVVNSETLLQFGWKKI